MLSIAFSVNLTVSIAHSQQIDVQSKATAGSGWTPWYELHVDPENASDMILCGSKWDAKDNAFYGFVYSSSNAGKTWRQAMEDRHSVWVSEQSCAFGVHGLVYFVSDASKVIDGDPHHDLGTTRIYVSHDSGNTWKLGIATGWADYSASVVDTNPGPNQNRLYVFFNNLQTFYRSLGNKDAVEAEEKGANGTRVGIISYRDGDAKIAGPFTSAAMADQKYHGSYPAPAFMLKDGSVLSFYTTKRRNVKNVKEFLLLAVQSSADRTQLQVPVQVALSTQRPKEEWDKVECGGVYLSSAATYDPANHRLYVAFPDVQDKTCRLLLTSSTDGGKSWSKAEPLYSPDETSARVYADAALAVNKDGVLGVLWQEKNRSGCWKFAASMDGGKSLSRAQELSTCTGEASQPSVLSTAYLWTSFFQADPKEKSDVARINLRNSRSGTGRDAHAIAATPDGAFHPVWIEPGSGDGEIRTATVRVATADSLISAATVGMQDVTNKVAVLYGGDQSFDPTSRVIVLEVTVKNNTDQALNGPFKLAVPDLYKNYGLSEIANADNKATGAGAVWDISASVPGNTLAPGATSGPFPLKFRYLANADQARDNDDILGLKVKVYAKP